MGDMLSFPVKINKGDIKIKDDFFKPGYGIPSNGGIEAIKEIGQAEGIFLDPIYTGKAMHGLLECIENKMFSRDDNIVFIHTGGFPSLFSFNKYF